MSIMNNRTKTLLRLSIAEFKAAPASERAAKIKHVERQLQLNENMPLAAEHYVQAGKIFLRIFKPRKLFTLNAYGLRAEAVQNYVIDDYNIYIKISDGRRVLLERIERSRKKSKTVLILQSLSWMRKYKESGPVKDDLYFAVQAMAADQQTSINNKL